MAPVKKAALPDDSRARTIARTILTIGLVVLSIYVAHDFLAPIGWAIVIAVTTWPLYVRFAGLFGRRRESVVAPLVFTLLVGALLLLPVGLAVRRAAQEIQAIEQSITQYRETGVPVPEWLPQVPAVGERATQWWQANLSDPKKAAEWLGTQDSKDNAAAGRALGAQVLHRAFFLYCVAHCSFWTSPAWRLGRKSLSGNRRSLVGRARRAACEQDGRSHPRNGIRYGGCSRH